MLMCYPSPWGSCSPSAWWPSSGGARSTGEQRGTFWASLREGSQGEQPLDKAWTGDLRPLHLSTCHQWCKMLQQLLILDQQNPRWPHSHGQFRMHFNERSTTTYNNKPCLLLHHSLLLSSLSSSSWLPSVGGELNTLYHMAMTLSQ